MTGNLFFIILWRYLYVLYLKICADGPQHAGFITCMSLESLLEVMELISWWYYGYVWVYLKLWFLMDVSSVVGLYEIDGVDQWMKAKKQLGMRGEVGKGAGSWP